VPELAAAYALGVLVSLSLVTLMLWATRRRRQSERLKILNANLAKVNLFWSDHRDALLERGHQSDAQLEETELRALNRSLLTSGLILSAMSWLGFFFLSVLFLSMRVLARSRLERRLFEDALATDPHLEAEKVQCLVGKATLR
jgi:hypothetical protein